jgi:auxin response factor
MLTAVLFTYWLACRPNILILFFPIFGFWKSAAEPAQAFSFSGLQRTQKVYHSNPNSIFSSSLNVGFNSKNERSMPNNNHLYWTIRETITESYSASINKDPIEKSKSLLLLAVDCLVLR